MATQVMKGYFNIDAPKPYLERNVQVSDLGFKDLIISTKRIAENKKVLLQEDIFEL
ncbi:hypothetical protein [uncultured Maribacter sp.]|uniref:hypothetical protein n=1 Tax=uncultured Maribacter sp. TaxID=431308 RepID=UPI0030DD2A38|tara:strand:- start:618 stop:785 length:168 start_codon:yes stop_codon:yes gene_type:complete